MFFWSSPGDFYYKETNASVIIKDDANNFFGSLGFASKDLRDPADVEGASVGKGLITNGENAKLTVNGMKIERQTNTFEIDGFSVSLNNTYNKNVAEGEEVLPITLTTKTDTDNMVDKIKQFVETYNGLIESLNSPNTQSTIVKPKTAVPNNHPIPDIILPRNENMKYIIVSGI